MFTPMGNGRIGVCCRYLDWVGVIDQARCDQIYERHEPDWAGPDDFQILKNGNYLVFANRNSQVPRGLKVLKWNPDTYEIVLEY